MFVKILLIVLFFASTLYIGYHCRKKAQNSNDFMLGGRNVGPWLSAFSYGTSYFSAVIFIGYAGSFGWEFGVSALWIGLGNAFIGSSLAWSVLGRRTRLITQKLNSATMPDFFGKRFDSKALKIVASVIVFVFLIPYTAALYNGLSSLFAIAFGFDQYWVWILIISIITGIYVVIGGLMSTAINSFIQGLIMLVGIALVVVFVLNKNGGLMGSLEVLAESGWEYTSIFGPEPVHLVFVVLLTSLGTWGLPQMVGKFYSITNEAQVKKGNVISTAFAIIVAGSCYFLGGFGRVFVEAGEAGAPVISSSNIIPTMVSNLSNNELLNNLLVGIVVVLVLAASMSTLASLVITSASTVNVDLISSIKKDRKENIWTLRVLCLVFIVVSAGLAIFQFYGPKDLTSDIASLMGVSWGAISGAFLGPFLFGLFWKKTTKASVWTSFVFGVGLGIFSLVMKFLGFSASESFALRFMSDSIYMGVVGMLASLIIVPTVSLFTRKLDSSYVEELFECYSGTVMVPAVEALVDPVDELVEE